MSTLANEDVRRAIALIGNRLLEQPSQLQPDVTLANGTAGLILVHSVLARFLEAAAHRRRALDLVEQLPEQLERTTLAQGLFVGVAGVAWSVEAVGDMLGIDLDFCSELDEFLRVYVAQSAHEDFDIVGGLSGVCIYFNRRQLRRPEAGTDLQTALYALIKLARIDSEGTRWWTPSHRHASPGRFPNGSVDLGLAHGAAGVISTLSYASNAIPIRARRDDAMRWLWSRKLPQPSVSLFGTYADSGLDRQSSRLGWCNGDLGVAMALLDSTAVLDGLPANERAIEIVRHAATRDADSGLISDPFLCHGSAGLGLLFNVIADRTGDQDAREAGNRWLGLAIRDVPGILDSAAPGILNGLGGIALALVASQGCAPWLDFLGLGPPLSMTAGKSAPI